VKEIYRKRGSSVRVEWSVRGRVVMRLSEEGSALGERNHFSASTARWGSEAPGEVRPDGIVAWCERFAAALPAGVAIERLTAVEGRADHEFESRGEGRRWSEERALVNATLVNRSAQARIHVELGGASPVDLDDGGALVAARLLAAFRGARAHPATVTLVPAVAAPLWPLIAEAVRDGLCASAPALAQRPHPQFQCDGTGQLIEPFAAARGAEWPNLFRPTYRAPAVAAFFHAAAAPVEETVRPSLEAVAHMRPPAAVDAALVLTLLVHEPENVGESRRLSLTLPLREIGSHLAGIGEPDGWYPHAAGSWGSRAVLRPPE
jgi:hypothetical protein